MFAYGAYLCKIFVFLNYKSIYKLIMTVKKYHQSDFTNENILFYHDTKRTKELEL